MAWVFDNSKPIYSQIEDEIKKMILSGKLSKGEKIQSVRELAQEAGVNPNTMQKALSEIERQGLIITERTNGRFVTAEQALIDGLKEEFFRQKVTVLIEELRSLEFTKNDIIRFIEKYYEEETDHVC